MSHGTLQYHKRVIPHVLDGTRERSCEREIVNAAMMDLKLALDLLKLYIAIMVNRCYTITWSLLFESLFIVT